MSRWVIIGGAGFTGLNLANKLINNLTIKPSQIIIADLHESLKKIALPVQLISCDISKNKIPELRKDDIVIHLAARQYHNNVPWKNRSKWFNEVNFTGTKNILKKILSKDIKGLIYFSSDMVYGIPNITPIKNYQPTNPIGPYGKSKLASEKILIRAQKNGAPITILRPRLIMGPGRLGIMKKLFLSVSNNKPIPLIGKGKNYYQMVSVEDCSDAIILSVQNNFPKKTLNLGSNVESNVREVIHTLIKKMDSRSKIIPLPANLTKLALGILDIFNLTILYPEQYNIADKNYIVDISDTYSTIGWKPKFSDIDMIISAYKYWKTIS